MLTDWHICDTVLAWEAQVGTRRYDDEVTKVVCEQMMRDIEKEFCTNIFTMEPTPVPSRSKRFRTIRAK